MSSTAWMAGQLQQRSDALRSSLDLEFPRYNPRPPGVIRSGSASDAVLAALNGRPGQWLTHAQVMLLSKRGTKAICWALAYLQAIGLIESTSDDSRNSRYRRYRLKKVANK